MNTPAPRRNWRQRIEQYGRVGLTIYLTIFGICLLSLYALLELGMADYIPAWLKDSPKFASAGTFAAAYILTKTLQPARIALTLAVTPFLARQLNLKLPAPPEQP